MPGSAMCDSGSAASDIRRITAKQPISPEATAIATASASVSALIRMLVNVEMHFSAIHITQEIRRENGARRTKACDAMAQAEHIAGVAIHHGELVRDKQHGQRVIASEER